MRTFWVGLAAMAVLSGSTAAGPLYQAGVQVGTVNLPQISEASGLAASRRNPGALWTHNDAGHTNQIFAIGTAGNLLGTYTLDGASALDFEDIAVGPGPAAGTSYIYVGDIGDNDANKPFIRIHRVAEPSVNLAGGPVSGNLSVSTFTLTYPDGPHNAESLMVDPLNGDLYLVTKETSIAHVYRAAFPQSTSSSITLQSIATLNGIDRATAGDISPGGGEIVVRNRTQAWQWSRPVGGTIADALALASQGITLRSEEQGEALGFSFGGTLGFFTTSEEVNQPIYFYATIPEPAGIGFCAAIAVMASRRMRRDRRPV